MRVRPPPPPSRAQSSSRKRPPSSSSISCVILSCRVLKYDSAFSGQTMRDYIQLQIMNSDIEHYVASAQPEFEAKLREWVEIPTISAEPDHKPDIERGAAAAVQYLRSL